MEKPYDFIAPQEESTAHSAEYYYDRYRQALKRRGEEEAPVRRSIRRLCALVITQACLMLLVQAGILYALRALSGFLGPRPYSQMVKTLFSYSNTAGLLFVSALYILCVFIPFGLYAMARRRRKGALSVFPHQAVSFRKIRLLPLATAFFVSLGAGVLAKWGNILIMVILDRLGLPLPQLDFSWPAFLPAQLLFIIAIGVLPAFIEEFNYRGVVLGELAVYHARGAVVFSSVLFALMHCNIAQFLYAFVIGLCIAYFVLKFRSLWVGVAVHFGFNVYGTVLPLMAGLNFAGDDITLSLIALLLDFALVFFGSVFLTLLVAKYRMSLPEDHPKALRGGRLAAIIFTSPVFYIMIAVVGVITALNALS